MPTSEEYVATTKAVVPCRGFVHQSDVESRGRATIHAVTHMNAWKRGGKLTLTNMSSLVLFRILSVGHGHKRASAVSAAVMTLRKNPPLPDSLWI